MLNVKVSHENQDIRNQGSYRGDKKREGNSLFRKQGIITIVILAAIFFLILPIFSGPSESNKNDKRVQPINQNTPGTRTPNQ